MMKLTNRFNNFFLKKYNEETNFVLFKQAQFISSLSIALGLIMLILLAVSFITSATVFSTALKPAFTLIMV